MNAIAIGIGIAIGIAIGIGIEKIAIRLRSLISLLPAVHWARHPLGSRLSALGTRLSALGTRHSAFWASDGFFESRQQPSGGNLNPG